MLQGCYTNPTDSLGQPREREDSSPTVSFFPAVWQETEAAMWSDCRRLLAKSPHAFAGRLRHSRCGLSAPLEDADQEITDSSAGLGPVRAATL